MRRVTAAVLAVALLAGLAALLFRSASPHAPKPSELEPVSAPDESTPPAPEPVPREPSQSLPQRANLEHTKPPFADEDDYLRTLETLNRTDKPRAFELVEKGESWYPATGEKTEARQALGITLLVDLGNMEEARARTRRFIAEHPTSRYRPVVQGVTGIHPRPSAPPGAGADVE
jgi:hypothetical protein